MDSLKVLDPEGPIREADIADQTGEVGFVLMSSITSSDSYNPPGDAQRSAIPAP
jgi:hypothetical protein